MDVQPTLAGALSAALRVQGNASFLGRRVRADSGTCKFEWTTYREAADASAELAAGLRSLAIPRRAAVGIASDNCPEWLYADFACAFDDFMNVGLHLAWSEDKLAAVMADADVQCVLVSSDGLGKITQAALLCPNSVARTIVLLGDSSPSRIQDASAVLANCDVGRRVVTWEEVLATGNDQRTTHTGFGFEGDEACFDRDDDASQPYTLMYSSGTSGGPPKATVNTKTVWRETNCTPGAFATVSLDERRAVSYLALAHGADRGICWQSTFSGGTIGFARGEDEFEGLLDDLRELKPTFYLGMAGFWCAVFKRHEALLNEQVDERLIARFREGLQVLFHADDEESCSALNILRQQPIWAELRCAFLATRKGGAIRKRLLNLARDELGSSLQVAATGGSLTPPHVREFMSHLMMDGNATRVKDSYGSTEFPGIATNGEVSPEIELKLVPVTFEATTVYSPDDRPRPRGEILVRRKKGEHMWYWKREDLTAKTWVDGWYHTGDVGELDYTTLALPNQYHEIKPALGHSWRSDPPLLRVIDRVKQLEEIYADGDSVWVAVGDLETFYETLPFFETVVLVSDRNENGLVAIAVLAETEVSGDVKRANAESTNPRGMPIPDVHRSRLLAELQAAGKKACKKDYEIPVGLVVETKRWNASEELPNGDRGLLTITGKAKKATVKEVYHASWMAQYAQGVRKESLTAEPDASEELIAFSKRLLEVIRKAADDERGDAEECGRPLTMKRGQRSADCRKRVRRQIQMQTQTLGGYTVAPECATDIEVLDEVKTVRGRDWLEDMECADGVEQRFEFGLVASSAGSSVAEWESLEPEALNKLSACYEQLRDASLHIRARYKDWEERRHAATKAASSKLEDCLAQMKRAVLEAVAPVTKENSDASVEYALQVLLRNRRLVDIAKMELERVSLTWPDDVSRAFLKLSESMCALKDVGDELDVNTRELPITWTVNTDWMLQEWRTVSTVVTCFNCNRNVLENQFNDHLNFDTMTCSDVGLAPKGQAAIGASVGCDTSISCEITGGLIDAEADFANDPEPGGGIVWACPQRAKRMHGIGYDVDRLPWAHEAFQKLHAAAQGNARAEQLMRLVDNHNDDVFGADKQGCFWLFDFVKYAGPKPHIRTAGKPDTPASLLTRAFDAFAERPCMAIPDFQTVPDGDPVFLRSTARTALVDAAGVTLGHRDGFLWMCYSDVGRIVDRIARGLLSLGLPSGAYVGIAGYNDFEFACADFAICRAGMVSVGLHGTYTDDNVVAVIEKVQCTALLFMRDLADRDSRRLQGRWCVSTVQERCPSMKYSVAMDSPVTDVSCKADASFLDWVAVSLPAGLQDVEMPDPFDACGAPYPVLDTDQVDRVTTVLFTSGSSGAPKAVPVGANAFLYDLIGCREEYEKISGSITVSYIPLSHSSDRYKVWQHVVLGGRVGFCQFGIENWSWREYGKESLAGKSPIDGLFEQIAALRPNSMSCPPNIWAGLRETFEKSLASGLNQAAALEAVAARFGTTCRMTNLATGGAKTPAAECAFAIKLCRHMGVSFVNSYGTTEAGFLTTDGRQYGAKYEQVQIQLVDWHGYTSKDVPFARGEIVVQSPCLALGYHGDNDSTRKSFIVAGTPSAADISPLLPPGRWYRTGDLGYFDDSGMLHLLDRCSAAAKDGTSRYGELEDEFESMAAVHHCILHGSVDAVLCILSVHNGVTEDDIKASEVWRKLMAQTVGIAVRLRVDGRRWTVKDGMLTGTLKKAPGNIIRHYFPEL